MRPATTVGPLVADVSVCFENDLVFLGAPSFLADARIQVIVLALPTLRKGGRLAKWGGGFAALAAEGMASRSTGCSWAVHKESGRADGARWATVKSK